MRVSLLVLPLKVVVVLCAAACGRSAEPVVACPQPAEECADIVQQQAAVEAVFADAVVAEDAAARGEAGECVAFIAEVSLDGGCVDRCDELCRLHPCTVLDENGDRTDDRCDDRCDELVEAGAVDDAALDVAIVNAADTPGFCSCRGCSADGDALCTQLFDCAP